MADNTMIGPIPMTGTQAPNPLSPTGFGATMQPTGTATTGGTLTGPSPLATADGTGNFAPGDTAAGMAPWSGFASRYTPAMAQDIIYESPWSMILDVLPGLSGGESNPLFQALRDFGADPLTLFNIMMGSQQKIDQGGGDFINFMEEFYRNMATPGGSAINAPALIQTLFGQEDLGADSQNTLGQILGAGDRSTQVRTLFNMLRDVSEAGMNPLAARGYQSAIAQAGDRYNRAMLSADEDSAMSPDKWIREQLPWLAGR